MRVLRGSVTIVVAELTREMRLGRVRRGNVAVVDAGGAMNASAGSPNHSVDASAVLAPLRVVPVVACGAAAMFGFTSEELAVASGPGGPTPLQRAVGSSMLGKVRAVLEADHPGVVRSLEAIVDRAGGPTAALAAMLATCCHSGWDPDGLASLAHPARRQLRAVETAACGVPGREPAEVTVRGLARAVAVLSDPDGARWAGPPWWRVSLLRVREAMLLHPELVSGEDAIDTTMICATDGRVWARHDPAGALLLALPERKLGIAVVDLAEAMSLATMAVEVLAELELLEPVTLERMARWLRLPTAVTAGRAAVEMPRTIG